MLINRKKFIEYCRFYAWFRTGMVSIFFIIFLSDYFPDGFWKPAASYIAFLITGSILYYGYLRNFSEIRYRCWDIPALKTKEIQSINHFFNEVLASSLIPFNLTKLFFDFDSKNFYFESNNESTSLSYSKSPCESLLNAKDKPNLCNSLLLQQIDGEWHIYVPEETMKKCTIVEFQSALRNTIDVLTDFLNTDANKKRQLLQLEKEKQQNLKSWK